MPQQGFGSSAAPAPPFAAAAPPPPPSPPPPPVDPSTLDDECYWKYRREGAKTFTGLSFSSKRSKSGGNAHSSSAGDWTPNEEDALLISYYKVPPPDKAFLAASSRPGFNAFGGMAAARWLTLRKLPIAASYLTGKTNQQLERKWEELCKDANIRGRGGAEYLRKMGKRLYAVYKLKGAL